MDTKNSINAQPKDLLDSLTHIWNHACYFLNSMALKCAIQLGIPDAIHKHGKPMTLNELASCLSIHPNMVPSLHQLMRLLVHSKFFSKTKTYNNNNTHEEEEEEAFSMTLNSLLLLKDNPISQTPFALLAMSPNFIIEPSQNLSIWFQKQDDYNLESPFTMTHGASLYERMPSVLEFKTLFNQVMTNDSQLVSSLLMARNEFRNIIDGVESLVDVGGGDGTLAKAIAEAYPKIKCIVLELPHVVEGLQGNANNLTFVTGNMFEAIPRAQVVLFKWVLHNWSDDDVIKALKKSKEAIPCKDEGGKLLIIEMVVGVSSDNNVNHSLAQVQMDMYMLCALRAKQRTKEQWKYLFNNAGFSDYKILPILGSRSIIEVYPA